MKGKESQTLIQKDLYLKLCNTFLTQTENDKIQMNMERMKKGLLKIGYNLAQKQIQQAFIYSSNLSKDKISVHIIFAYQTAKIDLRYLGKWLCIQNSKRENKQTSNLSLNIKSYKNSRKLIFKTEENKQQKKMIEGRQNRLKTENKIKLPTIRKAHSQSPQERMNIGLKSLINVFEDMRKQREQYGLIPIKVDEDESEYEYDDSNIPYSSQLHNLNKKISSLKLVASEKIKQIIQISKEDEKLSQKLQKQLFNKYSERLQTNERIGRYSAMKAHKRMIQDQKKQVKRFKVLKIDRQMKRVPNQQIKSSMQIN